MIALAVDGLELEACFDEQQKVKSFIERSRERRDAGGPANLLPSSTPNPQHAQSLHSSNMMNQGVHSNNMNMNTTHQALHSNNMNTQQALNMTATRFCECAPDLVQPQAVPQCYQAMQQSQASCQQAVSSHCHQNMRQSLCCACKLIQLWPACSCRQLQAGLGTAINKVQKVEENVPKADSQGEIVTDVKRIERQAIIPKIETAKRKVMKSYNYDALKPKHYNLELSSPLKLVREIRCEPIPVPERIPTIPFQHRPHLTVSRRTLFRSRGEQLLLDTIPQHPVFQTSALSKALSEMSTSIVTTTTKRGCCCQNAGGVCRCNNTHGSVHNKGDGAYSSHMTMQSSGPMSTMMNSAWMDPGARQNMWKWGFDKDGSSSTDKQLFETFSPEDSPERKVAEAPCGVVFAGPPAQPDVGSSSWGILRSAVHGTEKEGHKLSRGSSPVSTAGSSNPVGALATPLDYEDEGGLSPLDEELKPRGWLMLKKEVEENEKFKKKPTPLDYNDEDRISG